MQTAIDAQLAAKKLVYELGMHGDCRGADNRHNWRPTCWQSSWASTAIVRGAGPAGQHGRRLATGICEAAMSGWAITMILWQIRLVEQAGSPGRR
jgi:hypothetical protein